MSEHVLSAVLTFSLLAGGTAAIGSELVTPRHAPARAEVVVLPPVSVVARRQAAAPVVSLPRVTVVAKRSSAPTQVAVETRASDAVRIQ